MAQLKMQKCDAPKFMKPVGDAVFINDKIALTANPTAADTIDTILPAGFEISMLDIQPDDIDTNGAPTFVFSVGYAPVNPASSLAANATYFAAAGQTGAQSGTRLRCNFKPIKFEEDVYLRITVGTASATFAAGEIHAIALGNAIGPK